ncbi:MAG: SPOR domain-containing protein [Gemmatimonadota bacterium]|nr:MAG: SPOR domain-containing protein [Gemmatimonadota bacterium]
MQKATTVTIILILFAFMIMNWGCAFAPTSRFRPQEKDTKEETEEVEQVEEFDPLTLDEDGTAVPEVEEPREPTVQQGETTPETGPDTLRAEDFEQLQGYRVQIFLSSNLENAQKIMGETGEIFSEPAYLKYDAPYYKVRVGDCLTRREADLLREKAIRHGYKDAWVVRTLVNVPKY